MPPEQRPPPPRRPQRTRLWLTIAAVISAGYVLTGTVAGAKAVQELTRTPTTAELQRAAVIEVAERWRNWPTGRVFPERISYEPEQGGDAEEATRVGIAPGASCADSVDQAVASVLRRYGCAAVLRATYLDAPQGVVVTLGVVAFQDPAVAGRIGAQFSADGKPTPAVRAVGFPNTVTARFNDAARQASYARQSGPYLILVTAGQTDGRPAQAVQKGRKGLFTFASEMADRLGGELSKPARPDCTQPERWAC
jgi:hypothetical protein